MPIYYYIDLDSEKGLEIIRHFKEYDKPPTQEECDEAKLELDAGKARWERRLSKVSMKRGHRWGGSKGNW